MVHGGRVVKVGGGRYLRSLCLSCSPSSSLSDHNPDLEGFLLAKRLTGDGCTEGGWVYKGGMGFDKATGPASRQCFIKRGDL